MSAVSPSPVPTVLDASIAQVKGLLNLLVPGDFAETFAPIRALLDTQLVILTDVHRGEVERLRFAHQEAMAAAQLQHTETLHSLEMAMKDRTHRDAVLRDRVQRLQQRIAQLECTTPTTIGKMYHTHTAAELWADHPKLPPELPPWSSHPASVDHETILPLLRQSYSNEAEMYSSLIALLKKLLPASCALQVLDTSENCYLANRKPDITIQTKAPYLHGPIAGFVVALIEVKFPIGKVIAGGHRGQMLDCLYRLMEAQPWRQVFVGLVTSLRSNCLVKLTRSTVGDHKITEISGCEPLHLALSYLVDVVAQDPKQRPQTPKYSIELGQCHRLLGTTKNSLVAQFPWPAVTASATKGFIVDSQPSEGDVPWVAVKRSCLPGGEKSTRGNRRRPRSLQHEIELLRLLKGHTCPSLPRMVCHTTSFSEVGIAPVGDSLGPAQLSSRPALVGAVLQDVYDALQYLHEVGWVHRDVRWANIVVANGRGVLVDFETAYKLKPQHPNVPYRGGYLCVPPRLLDSTEDLDCITYEPEARDDWTAFLLLLVALILPGPERWLLASSDTRTSGDGGKIDRGWGFGMSGVANSQSKERRFLRSLWKTLRAAPFWNGYVVAAEWKEQKGVTEEEEDSACPYSQLRDMASSILPVVLPHTPISSPAMTGQSEGPVDSLVSLTEGLDIDGDFDLDAENEDGSDDIGSIGSPYDDAVIINETS